MDNMDLKKVHDYLDKHEWERKDAFTLKCKGCGKIRNVSLEIEQTLAEYGRYVEEVV